MMKLDAKERSLATQGAAVASPVPEQQEPTATDELWQRYREASATPAADADLVETLRNQLIEAYHPLVKHIAERLLQSLPKSIELDDLVSAGLFGLMDSIKRFEPERGFRFKTYCTTRIRGSILDQLRSQDWVPRLVRLKAGRIHRAVQQLTGEFGREPTHAELAQALEMDSGELLREMDAASAVAVFSLSETWSDNEEDGTMESVRALEDKRSLDPSIELGRGDLMQYLTRSLTHKERFIVRQYYEVGHTMREIGEILHLTESRVCQIHSNVMGRLRKLLERQGEGLQE